MIDGEYSRFDQSADIIISMFLMPGMLISQYFKRYQYATYVGAISRIGTPKIRELTIMYHKSVLSNLAGDITNGAAVLIQIIS